MAETLAAIAPVSQRHAAAFCRLERPEDPPPPPRQRVAQGHDVRRRDARCILTVDVTAGETPQVDRRKKKKRKNLQKNRTGSALAPMQVGIGADVGGSDPAAERSCCVTGCWASRCRPRVGVCWPVSVDVVVAVDIWLLVSMRTDDVAMITRHSMKSGADETAGKVAPKSPVPAFQPTCFAWSGSLFWWGGPFQ